MLAAGTHLPVELPEVEELRREVRRREWEDTARRALGQRSSTLASLAELLASAGDVGAGDSPIAQGLR